MIHTNDPAIGKALNILRMHPVLGKRIRDMEADSVNVLIDRYGKGCDNSRTDTNLAPKNYQIFICENGDALKAEKIWGIKGTTLENSLAHELGHVYFDWRKSTVPIPSGPRGVSPEKWDDVMDEAHARIWDNYSRPPGVIVPVGDVYRESQDPWHIILWGLVLLTVVFGFSNTNVYSQKEAAGAVNGQSKRKPPAKPVSASKVTVTGLLYFGGDGQGIQSCLLKTADGIIEIDVTKKTKIAFPEDYSAWNLGAEWRVTYHKSRELADTFEANSITYIATDPTIKAAHITALEYLSALAGERPDYKKAYSKLSPAFKRRLSLTDFESMYLDVEYYNYGSIRVCSHSNGKVVLMLAYTGELAHRVEIVESQFGYQINRFFNWSETLEKEEALCRKQL